MKKIFSPNSVLFMLIISISVAHCTKAKQDLQKSFALQVMTSGRWVVQDFTENNADVTTAFAPYEFQFLENGTVSAFHAGDTTTGSWVGDVTAETIYSNFPSANDTVSLLNDTWKITNNTMAMVEARPTNTTRTAYLKLVRK
jgi:hypothetical protein